MISARTQLVALLGHPVSHSLSPLMQNAAFAARALDWAYVALDVPPERLADAVRGLAAAGFEGANVTTPHKTAVVELCDRLEPFAARAGSVNTLVFRNDGVFGSSTDAEALRDVHASGAVVLGAGGAAKALVTALQDAGAEVRVFSRSGNWPPDATGAELLVNATPVTDKILVEPERGQQVIDLPYRADGSPTAFVAAARASGCAVIVDGREALARQGAASFEQWTGVPAPLDVMRAALLP